MDILDLKPRLVYTHPTLQFGFIFFDMEIFGEEGTQWRLVFFDVVEEILTGVYEVGIFFVILMISRFLF
jgi:hypothetical protein